MKPSPNQDSLDPPGCEAPPKRNSRKAAQHPVPNTDTATDKVSTFVWWEHGCT